MPMVGLCVLPRVARAKVDISLLLGSHDEEEKKKATTPAATTTATTVSAASESSRESAAPEPLAMQSSSYQLPNIQEESPGTPTATSPSVTGKRPATEAPAGQPGSKRQSKWSAEEDALIIELRGQGMKWDHISKRLPGRSPISCRLHYQNYLERRSEWDEDKKNKLARLYERFKAEMWSKIAEEMAIPWRAAEAMHWQIGEGEMARRAGVNPFYLTSPSTEHSRRSRQTPMQPTRSRSETGVFPTQSQLPSVAELAAGVPAYSPQPRRQSQPHEYNHTRKRTRSQAGR